VAYNLRELENWHARASKHCPDNPPLDIYGEHPLHQRTKWVHGFSMLTREARDQREQEWLDELADRDDDSDLLPPEPGRSEGSGDRQAPRYVLPSDLSSVIRLSA